MHRIVRLTGLALVITGIAAGTALAASSPSVNHVLADHLGQTTATLNADVNPNGAATSYVFQYGYTSAYGTNTPVGKAGHGTKFVHVSSKISGLTPGTVYHFRIVAINSHGELVGVDHTFKTTGPPPPVPTTEPATSVTSNSAVLNGTINPNNAVTGYEFQYGTTTSYGLAAPYPPSAVSPGSTPVPVSTQLTGLASATWFHYRLVAYHGNVATSYGADQEFLTAPSPRPKPSVKARTTPRRKRHKPFTFTTTGKVTGPSWIPPTYACNGTVAVRFWLGKHNVKTTFIPVAPDCTFAGTTTFNHKPGKGARNRIVTLKVRIYFRGNGYLAGRFAKTERITLG